MALQPVGTKRLGKDAGEEDKSKLKWKHEDQDDSPPKKLVDHQSIRPAQSVY